MFEDQTLAAYRKCHGRARRSLAGLVVLLPAAIVAMLCCMSPTAARAGISITLSTLNEAGTSGGTALLAIMVVGGLAALVLGAAARLR